jgi:hypothetical protein
MWTWESTWTGTKDKHLMEANNTDIDLVLHNPPPWCISQPA